MTAITEIWRKLMKWLTGKEYKRDGQANSVKFINEYNDKSGINLAFIPCNKIANYVCTDSSVSITSSTINKRAKYLDTQLQKLWRDIKIITSRTLGYGKYCVFPYYNGISIDFDYISQDRIRVLGNIGKTITDLVILCEIKTIKNTDYYRFRRYKLEDATHIVSEMFCTNNGMFTQISPISDWEPITPEFIYNVDRLLFGAFDCPTDPRTDDTFYRSKLTDGADAVIKDISEQFEYLSQEYKLKESRIYVERGCLGIDDNGKPVLTKDNVFAMLQNGTKDDLFEVFDPAIRSDPIFKRFQFSFELLEKQIGTSQGIFTNPESLGTYTNQSNIKRSVYDTYSIVTDMRANIKYAVQDIAYSLDVLAEAYGLTPQGEKVDYKIDIDWSNALIEDMDTEWQQQKDLNDRGGMDTAEMRHWLKGGTYDEAKARIDEIASTLPNIQNTLSGFARADMEV